MGVLVCLLVAICTHFLEVYLLEQRADVCLILLETVRLLSKAIVSIYSPTNSVCEFELLHILANTWCCSSF